MDLNTYISYIQDFLSDNAVINNDNIEVIFHEDDSGEIIGMEYVEKGRVDFLDGCCLILNYENGHVYKGDYTVRDYNYHYNDPENIFRFESKGPAPHVNGRDGTHWFYKDGAKLHSKTLKRDITNLNTKEMNFFIMLNICKEFIDSGLYPLEPNNCNYYNNIIREVRRKLNE